MICSFPTPILEAEPWLAMGSFLVKVGLQGAPAADVARPAVEAASQRVGVANVHFDCRNAWKKHARHTSKLDSQLHMASSDQNIAFSSGPSV